MGRWVKHIIFILMFLVLCFPLIQQNTGFINVRGLRGAGEPPEWPRFSLNTWSDGSFQADAENTVEQRIGFRPALIRIKNQLEYSLFCKANAKGVVVGRNRYLFEADYLRAYAGGDYPGDWFWNEKFRRAGMVRDTLQELGVDLAIVIEPSKASYYKEYIPEEYIISDYGIKNNYDALMEGCQRENINTIDLYSYFIDLKEQAPFPLFPKGGIHWSYYGMLRAMDTILPAVEYLTGKNVPEMNKGPLEPEKALRGTDDDLAQLMNLVFKPSHPDMTYPDISFEDVADTARPRVLAISDSFYFNIMNAGITEKAFANSAFWYYNVEIYPESWSQRKDTSMINYRTEVESMDLVMVMITERFFYKFAWAFFDRLFNIYFPHEPIDYRYDYTSRIISHYKWFDEVVAESELKGVSVEQGLEDHSGFQFWQDEQKGLLVRNQSFYEMKIRHNEDWMKQIREKAEKNGISVDRQIELDAAWTLENSKN